MESLISSWQFGEQLSIEKWGKINPELIVSDGDEQEELNEQRN